MIFNKPSSAEILVGVAAIAVAALLRSLADPWLGEGEPLLVFLAAIAVAAWYGGLWPGAVAGVLGYFIGNYLFVSPRGDFGELQQPTIVSLVLYALCAGAIIASIRIRKRKSDLGTLSDSIDQTLSDTNIVAWEWDVSKNVMNLSRNSVRSIGVPPRAGRPVRLLRHIHPQDRAKYLSVVRDTANAGPAFTISFRFIRPTDRKTLWLENHGIVIADDDGNVRNFRGILTDQTPTYEAQQALRHAEEQFRSSHDASLTGYSIFRTVRGTGGEISDFEWEYANPSTARVAGRRVGDLLGRTLLQTLGHIPSIHELVQNMVHVAESGVPREVDLLYESPDERRSFRNMIVKVSAGVAVEFFDTTDQTRLERELREKASALELADRRKNEFLALLGHELRNPLAPIVTSLDLLQRPLGEKQRESVMAILRRQVAHVVRLIDDLLEISRIDQGKIALHRQPIPLGQVISRGIESAKPNIESRQQQLIEITATPHACVDVDPARLMQVIGNLLNNAAKFTPPGGRIWITALATPAIAEIKVRDEGLGIDPANLECIFERFVQIRSEDVTATTGLGLGLTLVKAIVELHGGTVATHSEGLGKGSEFVIRLPLALDSPVDPPHDDSPPAVKPRRILVVDDNQDAVQTLAMSLTLQGHEVRTATSGQEALAVAEHYTPDFVLLDLGMPSVDGYETARRLRAGAWCDKTRLVALTGWGQHEDKARAFGAGFHHYLTKPVDPDTLARLLNRWSE